MTEPQKPNKKSNPQQSANFCGGMWSLLAAGVLGGLLGGAAISQYHQHFKLAQLDMEMEAISRADAADPRLEPYHRQRGWEPFWKNTTLNFCLVSVALGGVMGVAAGLGRKSFGAVIAGLMLGAAIGALFGAGGGWVAAVLWEHFNWNYIRYVTPSEETLKYSTYIALSAHAVAWTAIGISLAVTVSLVARKRILVLDYAVTSVFAGFIATGMYAALASLLFPLNRSELVIPTGAENQFLFVMLAGGLFGLAIGRVAASQK